MLHSGRYRQQVAIFRKQLDDIIASPAKKSERLVIDKAGYQSRAVPYKSLEQRMVFYGTRRFETVARVMSIFAILRDSEKLYGRKRPVQPSSTGAVWQAFTGTQTDNACHTCPTHIQLDGHLPTLQTKNVGLKRHIIIEFADCVLMPRSINEIDKVFDEGAGKVSFLDAAEVILNERGMTWNQGVEIFRDGVRDLLSPARDILFDTSGKTYVARSAVDQARIDMVSAYYQGLYLEPINATSIDTLANQVKSEMGGETTAEASVVSNDA